MRVFILLLFHFCTGSAFGQGVQFHKGDLASLFARAKKEHKPVYVDVYSMGCGPCILMNKKTFPDSAVGAFMNAHFINYKVDIAKGEGPKIAGRYGITGYPTALYFSSAGELGYQGGGYSPNPADFIKTAQKALDEIAAPNNLIALRNKYRAGRRDTAFLNAYLRRLLSLEINGAETAEAAFDLYRALPLAKRNDGRTLLPLALANNEGNPTLYRQTMRLLPAILAAADTVQRSSLETVLYHANEKMLDKAADQGPDSLEARLAERRAIVSIDPDYATLRHLADDEARARATLIETHDQSYIVNPYVPAYINTYLYKLTDSALATADSAYWHMVKDQIEWQFDEYKLPEEERAKQRASYHHQGASYTAQDLNNFAWSYYKSKRPAAEKRLALGWITYALQLDTASFMALDTKAHLLYALGRRSQAVTTQNQAIVLGTQAGADMTEYKAFLKELRRPQGVKRAKR